MDKGSSWPLNPIWLPSTILKMQKIWRRGLNVLLNTTTVWFEEDAIIADLLPMFIYAYIIILASKSKMAAQNGCRRPFWKMKNAISQVLNEIFWQARYHFRLILWWQVHCHGVNTDRGSPKPLKTKWLPSLFWKMQKIWYVGPIYKRFLRWIWIRWPPICV